MPGQSSVADVPSENDKASADPSTSAAGQHSTMVGSPNGLSSPQTWPSDGMADMHLSGSDPMMFPGIFTRGHRTGSFRNLGQAAEEQKPNDDVASAEQS